MIDKNVRIKIEGIPEGYTERCHSGSTATWQPKGASWHDESKMFKLDAPQRGLKAELIEGQWYWVCGCEACLGLKKDYKDTYFVCDEHNTCEVCGINRKDINKTPWGYKNGGWYCVPCRDRLDKEAKVEALSKFDVNDEDYDEWDFRMNDEILCPHCKSKIESTDYYESCDNEECPVCGGYFTLEVEYTASYTTIVKGDRLRLKDFI